MTRDCLGMDLNLLGLQVTIQYEIHSYQEQVLCQNRR